jgi:hypothetical protein
MTSPSEPRIAEVAASELRGLFNEGHFSERASRGDLTVRVKPGSEHPAPSAANEPPGTVSHILQYFDDAGWLVAQAHEYLRPDGTVGGSGRPDPKWLFIDGVIYKQRRTVLLAADE